MPRLPSDTVLLVIDVQRAIDHPKWGPRNNPGAEDRIAALIAAWREARMPVIHVRHDSREPRSPYRPGQPGNDFKPQAAPHGGEPVVVKHTNSAFIDTGLDALLTGMGTTTLAVCGVLTHNSVEATVRHAGNLGYRVFVAADACWAVDLHDLTGRLWSAEDVHQLSLAVIHGEYATVTDATVLSAAVALARSKRQGKTRR